MFGALPVECLPDSAALVFVQEHNHAFGSIYRIAGYIKYLFMVHALPVLQRVASAQERPAAAGSG